MRWGLLYNFEFSERAVLIAKEVLDDSSYSYYVKNKTVVVILDDKTYIANYNNKKIEMFLCMCNESESGKLVKLYLPKDHIVEESDFDRIEKLSNFI